MTDVLSCYPVHRAQTPPIAATGVVDPTDPTTAYVVELFRPDTQGGTQRVEGPRRYSIRAAPPETLGWRSTPRPIERFPAPALLLVSARR